MYWTHSPIFAPSQATGLKRFREQQDVDGGGAPETNIKKPASKKLKSKASPPGDEDMDDETSFKGYSLRELPKSAWPQPGKNNGKHGYTIKASNGAVTCILLVQSYDICPNIHKYRNYDGDSRTPRTCLPHPGNEAIEVLLKSRAFVVKRFGGGVREGDAAAKGQYTWAKHGGVFKCWAACKKVARWVW